MALGTETKLTQTDSTSKKNSDISKIPNVRWIILGLGILLFIGLLALAISAASFNPTATTTTPTVGSTNAAAASVTIAQHVTALVADPTNAQNLFAATDKGIQLSNDGGKTWKDSSSGLNGAVATALAMDAGDAEHSLYVGTLGAGLFKSEDSGKTWTNIGLADRDITAVAASKGHIYAAANGTFSNVYFSTDGGKTFNVPAKQQLPSRLDVRVIATDPVNPDLVYIGTAFVPDQTLPDYGRVKYSTDGGKYWSDLGQWQALSNNKNAHLAAMGAVTVLLPIDSTRIYAGNGQTLFAITPDLTAWQPVGNGLPQTGVSEVVSDPQDPTVVYAQTSDGFYVNLLDKDWTKLTTGTKTPLFPNSQAVLAQPILQAATTRNDAKSVNNLNATYLYSLDASGNLTGYENKDFGDQRLIALVGGPPLPDFTIYNGVNPADAIAPPTTNDPNQMYFKETGHFISGGFLSYWKNNGGLPIFGYPLTEEFSQFDKIHNITLTVQYFERAKFEYHSDLPANQRIQIGLLGDEAIAGKFFVPGRFIATTDTQTYYPITNHTIQGAFYQFWKSNGGLVRFGYPLTEQVNETDSNGQKIVAQYFERAKLEYVLDKNNKPGPVQIALLGRQVLVQMGWLKH